MKKTYLRIAMGMAFGAFLTMGLTACSDDNNDNNGNNRDDDAGVYFTDNARITSTISQKTAWTGSDYSNKSYGEDAIDYCEDLGNELNAVSNLIVNNIDDMNETQGIYLDNVIAGVVDNVIIPTYTSLADATEELNEVLKGLDVNSITQDNINDACSYFLAARYYWERSEAFLGGAASDFDVDPTIDSWPLDRSLLLTYFKDGEFTDEELEDASILGFHALEFILFRDGQPRKVAEFQTYDTYNRFESVTGAAELEYAQAVCELLYQRCCQLQVAWEGTSDKERTAVVKNAGLEYTINGRSYGQNMKNCGTSNSTFPTMVAAIEQLLSMEEGSCFGICNEVGTAKIANPFSYGDISYVESPYSYNSITDFQNNIESIRNVWFGGVKGANSDANYSFHGFFKLYGSANINNNMENAITNAVNGIGSMPFPFVTYVSTVWNKEFETYQ